MRFRGITVAGVFVIGAATLVGLGIHRDDSLRSSFDSVANSMADDKVVEIMGSTRFREACDSGFLIMYPFKGCVEVDMYPSSFAPLVPEYWVIYFDKNGRVFDKFDFQSP